MRSPPLPLVVALTALGLVAGGAPACGESSGSSASKSSSASSGTGSASSQGATAGGATTTTSGAGGLGAGGAGEGGASATTTGAGGALGTGGAGGVAAPVWGAAECPAPPAGVEVGFAIGNQLAEIVVKDCDGNDVSLTELCGAKALWIFAAHGWCPFCTTVSAKAEAIEDGFSGANLAVANVIVQDGQGNPPDSTYCKVWRAKFGQDDVRTYYDPTGAVLALFPEQGTTSLSAFMDRSRIIRSKLFHTADIGAIEAGIQVALTP